MNCRNTESGQKTARIINEKVTLTHRVELLNAITTAAKRPDSFFIRQVLRHYGQIYKILGYMTVKIANMMRHLLSVQ